MECITLKIINWEKYNPRRDYKKPWWFALSNTMITDPQFFHFTGNEFKCWIYFLSVASQKQTDTIKIYVKALTASINASDEEVSTTIDKLQQNDCIQVVAGFRTESVQNLYSTEQNRTEQLKKLPSGSFSPDQQSAGSRVPKKASATTLIKVDSMETMQTVIDPVNRSLWAAKYGGDEYLQHEIHEMVVWLRANPGKASKTQRGWAMFVSNWLSRGWPGWQKKIPSMKPAKTLSIVEILKERGK